MRNFMQGFFGSVTLVAVFILAILVNTVYEKSTLHVELTLPAQESTPYLQYVYNDAEIKCLQENMFYEARNQGDKGMLMVGFVTMHRAFANKNHTICGAVHTKGSCDFSWTCTKKKQDIDWKSPLTIRAWEQANTLSIELLVAVEKDFTQGANFYHTKSCNPYWSHAKGFVYLGMINDHKLYRYDG